MAKTEKVSESINNEDFYNIYKIKIDKDSFGKIVYGIGNKKEKRLTEYDGKEQVTTFFENEFQDLKQVAKYIIPQIEDINDDDIKVNSISLKYDIDFLKGVTMSLSIKIREDLESPLNLNTPYVTFGGDKDFVLGDGFKKTFEKIINKAKEYMNGDTRTKQLKLVKE